MVRTLPSGVTRRGWAAVQQYAQAAVLLFADRLKEEKKNANCTVAHTLPDPRCCRWPAATSSEPTELTDTSARRIRNHLFLKAREKERNKKKALAPFPSLPPPLQQLNSSMQSSASPSLPICSQPPKLLL